MSVKVRKVSAADLAADLGLKLLGENFEITNLCSIHNPQPLGLTFLNERNVLLPDRKPDLPEDLVVISKYPVKYCATILSDNPTLDFVRAVYRLINADEMLDDFAQETPIHPNAIIERSVKIGPNSVICAGAVISEGCIIGPNCYVGRNVRIGSRTVLQPGAKILRDCVIGSDCIIGPGTVIGSDGFGYIRGASGLIKFPQLGRVVVGDRVETGANVTIDRGALDDTVISHGVKLDNLVQVGHNVFIGENSLVCGQAGIAGSSVIGRDCVLGGQVGVADHVKICDGVRVGGKSGVRSNLLRPGDYLGDFGALEASLWRRFVGFLRLEFKKRCKRTSV